MVSVSSSSSTSMPPTLRNDNPRNWADLPPELTSSILSRLPMEDIIENAQKVCSSWRRVCKDPSMWRKIKFRNLRWIKYELWIMCPHVVDRSQGGLVEIDIWDIGTNSLLNYITKRSRNLRSLKLAMCYPITDEGFAEAVVKVPFLEELEISYCSLSGESLKVAGRSCPNLKTLKLNRSLRVEFDNDDDAIAISDSMPELRHLQLVGNGITNTGLNVILDGCPHLEHLDLRMCFNVNLVGDLEKRCVQRIKNLRRPNDSTADYPFDAITDSLEEEDYDDDVSSIDSADYLYYIFRDL